MRVIRAGLIIRDFTDPASDVVGGSLVVEGDVIREIHEGAHPDHGDETMDLSECVVAPGLMDCHVHLAFDGSADPVANMRARSREDVTEQGVAAAHDLLLSGVTYARDLGAPADLAIRLRDEVADGRVIGPTIHAAGRPMTRPEGHCWFMGVEVRDEAAVRSAVTAEVERGADLIKLMVTGGRMTPGTDPHQVELPPQLIAAAVEEAHALGRPVTAHALSTGGVIAAARAKVDCVEHATLIGADPTAREIGRHDAVAQQLAIELVADNGVAVSPTFSLPASGSHPVHPSVRAAWIAAYRDGGASVVAGTDSGIDHHPHQGSLVAGLRGLVASGMSNTEALAAASQQGMRAVGRENAGALQPGFVADFIALPADPRADLEVLNQLDAVMAGGRPYRVVNPRSGRALVPD